VTLHLGSDAILHAFGGQCMKVVQRDEDIGPSMHTGHVVSRSRPIAATHRSANGDQFLVRLEKIVPTIAKK
jgi:hypothetical protein